MDKPGRAGFAKRKVALTSLGALLASSGAYFAFSDASPPIAQSGPAAEAQTDAWLARVRADGRNGDWISIRGYHVADHLVAGATLRTLSHAAILDLDSEEIIEAVFVGLMDG